MEPLLAVAAPDRGGGVVRAHGFRRFALASLAVALVWLVAARLPRAASDRRAELVCPLEPLVEHGPPIMGGGAPPPPRTMTESFALELENAHAPFDTHACAAGLAAAFAIPPHEVSVEARAAPDGAARSLASRVVIDVRVTHARAAPFSALSALDALPRERLARAVGADVTSGLPLCVSVLHVNDQHSRVEPVNAQLNTWGSREDVRTNATKYGGAALVWGALAARRAALLAAGRNVVVVNAGDEFQGSPYFRLGAAWGLEQACSRCLSPQLRAPTALPPTFCPS